MSKKKALSPTEKLCPLRQAAWEAHGANARCLGEKCALYIRMMRPRLFGYGQNTYPDSETYLRYEGCGLVAQVPWEIAKREKKQDASAK